MDPERERIPERLRKPASNEPRPEVPEVPEVGEFRQGSPVTHWALARYLVGRALTESVGSALLVLGVLVLALAAIAEWVLHSTVLAVLIVIIAVGVLLLRWILLAVVRRLTAFAQYAPIEARMTALVSDTRSDVLRELRRIGLPGRPWTLPLLVLRFARRSRRADTLARLRRFEINRVVPAARLDELVLLLRQAVGDGGAPPTGR